MTRLVKNSLAAATNGAAFGKGTPRLRFDDVLDTVLSTRRETPQAAAAAWRQLVDLVGRGRVAPDAAVMERLRELQGVVPAATRTASARALIGAQVPFALVDLLAADEASVAAPLLRHVDLAPGDWTALLPRLNPTARAVLRHRRDLPAEAVRALESFGAVDFVLPDHVTPAPVVGEPVADPVPRPTAAEPQPFRSVGSVARAIPLVAEALRRESDPELPAALPDGTFRIADVVARIEAFQRDGTPPPANDVPPAPREQFLFESDARGIVRWVEGTVRGAIVGLSIAAPAQPGGIGVDAGVAGAFRRRTAFSNARLVLSGGAARGVWLISAVPVFDPATGRFTGYRGHARRPDAHEQAGGAVALRADALRQLVHELRTPTNAIAGFSEMIEHQLLGPVSDTYRAQAAAIRSDAGSLLAAIEDLDAAARSEAGALDLSPEPLDLAEPLGRVLAELAPLRAARGCTVTLPSDTAGVVADRRTLERLLLRLLGTLVGAAERGEVLTGTIARSGGTVALAIDRPQAFAEHRGDSILQIDDEHSPASLLGTGFTLRLVRNLAQALGGSLVIEAGRLVLVLPAAAAHQADHIASG